MTDYMTKVMWDTKIEAMRQHTLDRYYQKMHLNNLISRATMMEERGNHLEEKKLTALDMRVILSEIAGVQNITTESRHRMAKEIAEELLADKGEQAHFYCVEKLAGETKSPKLWRDVLSFLDEMEANDGGERCHENTESNS